MNRKRWIAWTSVIAAVGCSAAAPDLSSAHSTLLSGYGGPGAGEQTIIGSTLLNGPRGRSGSGGKGAGSNSEPSVQSLAVPAAGGSGRSGAVATNGSETATASAANGGSAASGNGGAAKGSGTSAPEANRPGNGQAAARRGAGSPAVTVRPYVYPSALRSTAGSHPLGLSSGDLLAIAAIVAGMGAFGALTVRAARLQR